MGITVSEIAHITRIRLIVSIAALAMIIIGFSVSLYTMISIQSRESALNDVSLTQDERWNIEGSLQWWQQQSRSLFYPAAAILIVLGITVILYVVLVR